MAYEIEMTHRIYSNCGYYFEIRPDPDGLEMVEIRYFEDNKSSLPRQAVSLTEDAIPFVIKALEVQLQQIKDAKR